MDEEQIEFKNEDIDQGFISTSIINTSLYYQSTIKQEVSDTNVFDKHEGLEESDISVKSETDIKPEIIFGISESDSQHLMSDVISDPLDITAHEQKYRINIKCSFCPKRFGATLDLKKHLDTEHKVVKLAKNASLTHKMTSGKKQFECSICLVIFTRNFTLKRHISKVHDGIKSVQDDFINEKRKKLKSE